MGPLELPLGTIVWCDFDPVVGREQGGRRPALVIASHDFSETVKAMTIVVPCTTRDRGWLSHVPVTGATGLPAPTYALSEQPRSINTERVLAVAGRADYETVEAVLRWVRVWTAQAA